MSIGQYTNYATNVSGGRLGTGMGEIRSHALETVDGGSIATLLPYDDEAIAKE